MPLEVTHVFNPSWVVLCMMVLEANNVVRILEVCILEVRLSMGRCKPKPCL